MSFLTLDLNLLRVFDAVMSEQNMTRAADRLATTQPAVSNALKRLRDTLDDELVVRTAHGVKPTARAVELWPAVRLALNGLEAAIAPDEADLAALRATFRLAMADSTASLFLPPLMGAIKDSASGLDVHMLPLPTRDPRPLLIQNEIDIAIGSFPGVVTQLTGGQGEESPIRHQRLYSSETVCIMRKDHPLSAVDMTLDRYCDALHVLMSFSGRAHGPADVALSKIGRARRVALTVNQFFTVGQVVAKTDLISIVPRHLVASIGMDDTLVMKPLPFDLPHVQVDLLWHERDMRNRAHKWLRETLAAIPSNALRGLDA